MDQIVHEQIVQIMRQIIHGDVYYLGADCTVHDSVCMRQIVHDHVHYMGHCI